MRAQRASSSADNSDMTKQQYCLVLLVLTCLGFAACKKQVQADYENALAKGVVLVENDTIEVEVGENILFDFSFADGVNPIHYAWEIYQQDTQQFRYLGLEDFHFAEDDVVGGPAAGIHSYEALAAGVYSLVFYNPYYNEEQLQKEKEAQDVYSIWKALKEDFATYDSLTDWNRANFEQHWMALQDADGTSKDSLWKVIYQNTYTTDSLLNSTARRKLLGKWAAKYTPPTSSSTTLELLDTLLGDQMSHIVKTVRQDSILGSQHGPVTQSVWHDLRNQQDQEAPLHPSANPKTYHVRVRPK